MEARKGKQPHPFHHWIRIFKITLLGVIVLSTIFALNQLKLSRYFPITTVKVYGLNHIDRNHVQEVLTPLVSHGFFSANVDRIRDELRVMSWVSDIFVRRNWPDQIDITVVEKNAVARWNGNSLLSDNGELFNPEENSYPENLPLLVGPPGQHIMMLSYLKDINRTLSPLHAKISSIELTPYLTWKLTLDNGIQLQVGHKDFLTRLDHFVKVYPKIIGERAPYVDYIDLRYPNGLAVQWKAAIKT